MSSYRVTLKDRSTEEIDDVDAYQQEGQMTTFFRTGSDRQVVDTWSTRMASFRTSEILAIRRLEPVGAGVGIGIGASANGVVTELRAAPSAS